MWSTVALVASPYDLFWLLAAVKKMLL